ncbi:TPR domain protein [Minicystis rosea]|nr:TPR domain protein [Minicystis rosea]
MKGETMHDGNGAGGAPGFVLESGLRLSQSMLWDLQRRFFEQQGIEAWRRGAVPLYITSNPFIAGAYAAVVMGYLEDCQAAGASDEPVYIVELGAGSGRFAYLFLKKLLALHRRPGARAAPFVYVMTDLAARNLAHAQAHPSLQPFCDEGVLDFARFDAEHDDAITLVRSGVVLTAGAFLRPLVVIANYVFDSIPQDAFRIHEGRLYESSITLVSKDAEPDTRDPTLITRVTLDYDHRPAPADPYDDPLLNDILHAYTARLGTTSIRFPIAALRCCRTLARIAGGRLLLLSADRGSIHEDQLRGHGEAGISVHGSFSLSVDYHAVAECFRGQGGFALHTAHEAASLIVAAFFLGAPEEGCPAARRAFADAVERFGPDDFFSLKKGIEKGYDALTLPQLLAFLRLADGDPRILSQCLHVLIERARSASMADEQEIQRAVARAWEHYYHLGEEPDLPFGLGMLLYEMGCHRDALTYFERSFELYGASPHTIFNMGMCHYELGEMDDALACARRVLALDPLHDGALAMRAELERAWDRAVDIAE